jgi:hypothetical protein
MWPFSKRTVRRPSSSAPGPEPLTELTTNLLSPDLALYFAKVGSGDYSEHWDVEVNLLNLAQSERWTQDLSFHPIIQAFDGRVLDDPNTSNHHIYLNRTVLTGCILFLSHDGDTRIVYSTLVDFLGAADAAKQEKHVLSEIHPSSSPILKNQVGLSGLILDLYPNGDAGNEAAVLALIPSMDLLDKMLLKRLVIDTNFFFGEAVAIEIEKRPTHHLVQIAELCAGHEHMHVRNAGHKALAAIRQLNAKI